MTKVDLLYNQLKSALYDIEEIYSTHEITSVNLDISKRVHSDSINITLDIEVLPLEEDEEEEPPSSVSVYSKPNGYEPQFRLSAKDFEKIIKVTGVKKGD